MGLRYSDLDRWQSWQDRRNALRRAKARLRGRAAGPAEPVWYARGPERPDVIVGVDSASPTSLASVLEPLRHLDGVHVAVLSAVDLAGRLGEGWAPAPPPDADPRVLLTLGAHLGVGARLARTYGRARHGVVQHGLLTSLSPPAPPGADLLTWSDADADFWTAGRPDLHATTVGSQLLWAAAARPVAEPPSRFLPPVYLGQLHGAELPRAAMARAALAFCRETGATYRPHPAETDRLSRLAHRALARVGVQVRPDGRPLAEVGRPLVSVFSTGVLEGAALGLPTWVHYPAPPTWLADFWHRYRMSRWGDGPTPVPEWVTVDTEPARAVAEWVRGEL